jgi:hypothetical protein
VTSPYCQHCGFQPPDPVAYHERTAELAAANEEIARLQRLVLFAWDEGFLAGNVGRNWDLLAAWNLSVTKAGVTWPLPELPK